MDVAPTARGVCAGGWAAVSDSGPRSSLWRTIFASGQDDGHSGGGNCAPRAVAKRVCRAGDWLDSTRMSRPCCGDRRTASSRDPVEVRRLLQRDTDTFIAVERRTQASDCAAAESGQSGEGAARRWTASRIPAAGGMRPIGRISGRHSPIPSPCPTIVAPRGFVASTPSSVGALPAPAVQSMTTSTPRPPVTSRTTASASSFWTSTTVSAPKALATSRRRLSRDVPVTMILAASAAWTP